jgi:hypothetical protein
MYIQQVYTQFFVLHFTDLDVGRHCATRVHKSGSETPPGDLPKVRARDSDGSYHRFAFAQALPLPKIFALCSLNCQFLKLR